MEDLAGFVFWVDGSFSTTHKTPLLIEKPKHDLDFTSWVIDGLKDKVSQLEARS